MLLAGDVSELPERRGEAAHPDMNLPVQRVLQLVLAYAAGYFLSYGLRTINAVIAPELMRDLQLTATGLGLLTSAYFLAFGLFQLPLGLLLDRFGPRRVEAALLLVAAAGCALFALGQSLATLALARALIGVGVSACLMASLKAFTQWFPLARLPSLSATIMVSGALGALSSSVPVEAALPLLGWRGLFVVLAVLLVLVSALLMTLPEHPGFGPGETLQQQLRILGQIFRARVFWRFAPQSFCTLGGFMAIQSLWALPWMTEVNRVTRSEAAQVLFLMSLAMLLGYLFLASCSGWLSRRGVPPLTLLKISLGGALTVSLALLFDLGPPVWLWPLLGLCLSFNNLSYAQLTAAFPVAVAGKVNTAINLIIFFGAFGLQWGFGAVAEGLTTAGLVRADAYRVTFAALLLAQALSFAWFLVPPKQTD